VRSLDFSIDPILPAAPWPWGGKGWLVHRADKLTAIYGPLTGIALPFFFDCIESVGSVISLYLRSCFTYELQQNILEKDSEVEQGNACIILSSDCVSVLTASILQTVLHWRHKSLHLQCNEVCMMVAVSCFILWNKNWNCLFVFLQLGRTLTESWTCTGDGWCAGCGLVPLFHYNESSWLQEWYPPR
jgi:hypothetical protein